MTTVARPAPEGNTELSVGITRDSKRRFVEAECRYLYKCDPGIRNWSRSRNILPGAEGRAGAAEAF